MKSIILYKPLNRFKNIYFTTSDFYEYIYNKYWIKNATSRVFYRLDTYNYVFNLKNIFLENRIYTFYGKYFNSNWCVFHTISFIFFFFLSNPN